MQGLLYPGVEGLKKRVGANRGGDRTGPSERISTEAARFAARSRRARERCCFERADSGRVGEQKAERRMCCELLDAAMCAVTVCRACGVPCARERLRVRWGVAGHTAQRGSARPAGWLL